MHSPQEPQLPRRRQRSVEIAAWNGALVWTVFEPSPMRACRILARVARILGPVLVQVLAGRVRLPKAASCPVCKAANPERINGDRWLCSATDDTGQRSCRHVWPLEWMADERGVPVVLSWGMAMGSEVWRHKVADAIERQLEGLDQDGDQVVTLICDLLVGACEVASPGMPPFPIRDAEQLDAQAAQCRQGPKALMTLARTALECWVLPMLGDEPTATSPDTTASATAGDTSPTPRTGTDGRLPAIGRALPRTARRQG